MGGMADMLASMPPEQMEQMARMSGAPPVSVLVLLVQCITPATSRPSAAELCLAVDRCCDRTSSSALYRSAPRRCCVCKFSDLVPATKLHKDHWTPTLLEWEIT